MISFVIAPKRIKYIGINFYVKYLYTESYITLRKEIKARSSGSPL